MDDNGVGGKQICITGLYVCESRSCNCKRTERIERFLQLLNRLSLASQTTDYEEQISTIVATICAVCTQFNLT